jgi:hypothetical protein
MTISLFCPHCHKHTALSAGTTRCSIDRYIVFKEVDWESPSGDKWWIGICNGCGLPCLVKNEGVIVYPHPRPSPTDTNIPKELARDLDESKICLSVDCYRACAAMARRCIQNACLHKGTTAKDLVGQIAELAHKGVITKDIAEWATVVR